MPVAAIIDLVAESLDEEAEGEDVTAYIELPRGFDVAAIDVASVVLCTSTACVPADAGPGEVGDFDGDSVTDYMVEFDGRLVIALVADTAAPVEITFTVSGLVAGVPFAGADAIQIVGPDEDATSPVSTPQVSELSVSPEVSVSPETSEYPRWARRGRMPAAVPYARPPSPAGSRVTTCRCIRCPIYAASTRPSWEPRAVGLIPRQRARGQNQMRAEVEYRAKIGAREAQLDRRRMVYTPGPRPHAGGWSSCSSRGP